jgi:hypothetical protein
MESPSREPDAFPDLMKNHRKEDDRFAVSWRDMGSLLINGYGKI